jgi:cytochrome c biogenesis protein CcmG, thiol:disulfide interchange protein DsbE
LSCGKLSAVRLRTCSIALIAAAGLAGCGSSQPRNDAPSPTAEAAAFKQSPPPLRSLHAQANRLLAGGLPAFRARLAALHGYPVVVNKWASWCGPCQTEFPAFQRAAVKFGRQVAFIGLDAADGNGSAAAFLHRYPVSYPSYTDPHSNIAQAYRASTYFPQTLFFRRDRHGDYVFDHAGPYESAAALEQDIRQYVLR